MAGGRIRARRRRTLLYARKRCAHTPGRNPQDKTGRETPTDEKDPAKAHFILYRNERRDPEKLTDEEKEDVIRDLYETNFRVYDRLAEI